MSKANAVCRRFVCLVAVFVFLMAAPLLSLPGKALDATPALRVYAQYWADPDSATLLGEFTREELDEMSYSDIGYEGYYCNVTRVNTVMRIHARGVRLAEFLSQKVGVDLTSVRQLDFHTTDVGSGERFVSKGRQELLDDVRWYYPNLYNNFHADEENNCIVIDDEAKVMEGAVQVPTIIATVQYATKNPYDDLSEEMTTEDTFRLCAGQVDMTTKSSFESARAVDEIYIVFAGAPPEEPSTDPEPPPESPTEPAKTGGQDIPTETPAAPSAMPSVKPSTTHYKPEQPPNYDYRPWTGSRSTTRWQGNQQLRPSSYTPTAPVTTAPYAGAADASQSGQMGRLYLDGYDSLIQWKQESPDDVTPLQKPEVTTNGMRNALLLFLISFAAGTILMYTWFKKER